MTKQNYWSLSWETDVAFNDVHLFPYNLDCNDSQTFKIQHTSNIWLRTKIIDINELMFKGTYFTI